MPAARSNGTGRSWAQSRERAILSIRIDWADDVAETDCVAEHAVHIGLVSSLNSLLTGNLIGNSWVFSPFSRFLVGIDAQLQWLAKEFPKQQNRELIRANRESFSCEQGTCKRREHCDRNHNKFAWRGTCPAFLLSLPKLIASLDGGTRPKALVADPTALNPRRPLH